MEILSYVQDRWVTLYPSIDYYHSRDNIVYLLCLLNRRQWGYFAVRIVQSTPPFQELTYLWIGWVCSLGLGCVRLSHCHDNLH